MKTDETKKARVIYPEYWAKRKKRLNAGFIKMLEETAQKEAECSDEYGEYKTGTFLYKSAIVSVRKENPLDFAHDERSSYRLAAYQGNTLQVFAGQPFDGATVCTKKGCK